MSSVYIDNPSVKKQGGIKIVENNRNYKVTDIFNLKKSISYSNYSYNKYNKQRMIEVTEKLIDSKLRVLLHL